MRQHHLLETFPGVNHPHKHMCTSLSTQIHVLPIEPSSQPMAIYVQSHFLHFSVPQRHGIASSPGSSMGSPSSLSR